MPPAGAVLRRALIVWGSGHLALGDRRGWLLVIAQPLALVGLGLMAALLIDGTRWMVVFPALLMVLAVWLVQAVAAQRRALELGARPGGEMQVVVLMPVLFALVTAFWLAGGDHGSAAATLREYVAAWRSGQPSVAASLFREPTDPSAVGAAWAAQRDLLAQRVALAAATYGPASGIDPTRPFNSLRLLEERATADTVVVGVEIVRRQRVETMLLDLIPTAQQQTVVVERLGQIVLRAVPAAPPDWWPDRRPLAQTWTIESVELNGATP